MSFDRLDTLIAELRKPPNATATTATPATPLRGCSEISDCSSSSRPWEQTLTLQKSPKLTNDPDATDWSDKRGQALAMIADLDSRGISMVIERDGIQLRHPRNSKLPPRSWEQGHLVSFHRELAELTPVFNYLKTNLFDLCIGAGEIISAEILSASDISGIRNSDPDLELIRTKIQSWLIRGRKSGGKLLSTEEINKPINRRRWLSPAHLVRCGVCRHFRLHVTEKAHACSVLPWPSALDRQKEGEPCSRFQL